MAFWFSYWLVAVHSIPLDSGVLRSYWRDQLDRGGRRWFRRREQATDDRATEEKLASF